MNAARTSLRAPHHPYPTPPRSLALALQLYLKIDRHDLAEKTLKAMTTADDESALTQISSALLYLAQVRLRMRWVRPGRQP